MPADEPVAGDTPGACREPLAGQAPIDAVGSSTPLAWVTVVPAEGFERTDPVLSARLAPH